MDTKKLIPEKIKETLVLKRELRELNEGKDLLDNYGWREYAMWDTLRYDYPSLDLLIGRTGPDFECPDKGIYAGEMKSGQFDMPKKIDYLTPNKGSGEFDKQTDPLRREETLGYDGFIFGLFLRDEYVPVTLMMIDTESGVDKMRDILKDKQNIKVGEIKALQSIGKKTPRDSIVVSFNDIYSNLDTTDYSVYFKGTKMDTGEYIHRLNNKDLKL